MAIAAAEIPFDSPFITHYFGTLDNQLQYEGVLRRTSLMLKAQGLNSAENLQTTSRLFATLIRMTLPYQ
jgi:hypothetical protein